MGWGELAFYIVSAALMIVCCVLYSLDAGKALTKGLSGTTKTRAAIEAILGLSFIWYILAFLGRFFLQEVLNIQRNVCVYKKSYLLLFLKSDLIASFFSNLSIIFVLFIDFALGKNMLLAFSTIGPVVDTIVHVFVWYPSLRYVLNKEGLYQPGVIKSYVWMWCKWVWIPLLAVCVVGVVMKKMGIGSFEQIDTSSFSRC